MSYTYKGLNIVSIIEGGSTTNTSYTGFPLYRQKTNNFDTMNTELGFKINGVDIISNAAAINTDYGAIIQSPSDGTLDFSVSETYTLTINSTFNHMTVALIGGGGGGFCGQGDGGPSPATTQGASGSGGGSGAVAYMERIPLSTNGYSYSIQVGGGGRGVGGEYKGNHFPPVNTSTAGTSTYILSNNITNNSITAG